MQQRPRILLACHTFPPYKGIGGRRWAKFAKALAHKGFQIDVVCADGGDALKGSSWSNDIQHENIHIHLLPFKYPKIILKRKHQDIYDKLSYHFWIRVLPFVSKGNFFDKAIFWEKQFKVKCAELIEARGIKYMITTGAPFRLLAYSVDLKEQFGLTLISDLRDIWTNTVDYGLDSVNNSRRKYEADLEQRVMMRSDKVIFPHPMVVEHVFNNDAIDRTKFIRVRHAVDPDDIGQKEDIGTSPVFKTMYAGSLYGGPEAAVYFDKVILAYREIKRRGIKARLDLYITEHNTIPYEQKVRDEKLDGHIFFHDAVPATEVFAKMHHCDMVQLFIPKANKDLMGTKFTEIFHLRKPLLHVGDSGVISEYIGKHKLGRSISVAELPQVLPDIIEGKTPLNVNQQFDLSEHGLEHITNQLITEVLELPL